MRIFKSIVVEWKLLVEEVRASVQVVQLLTETAATAGSWRTTGFRTGHDSGSTKPVGSSSSTRLIVADVPEVLTTKK